MEEFNGSESNYSIDGQQKQQQKLKKQINRVPGATVGGENLIDSSRVVDSRAVEQFEDSGSCPSRLPLRNSAFQINRGSVYNGDDDDDDNDSLCGYPSKENDTTNNNSTIMSAEVGKLKQEESTNKLMVIKSSAESIEIDNETPTSAANLDTSSRQFTSGGAAANEFIKRPDTLLTSLPRLSLTSPRVEPSRSSNCLCAAAKLPASLVIASPTRQPSPGCQLSGGSASGYIPAEWAGASGRRPTHQFGYATPACERPPPPGGSGGRPGQLAVCSQQQAIPRTFSATSLGQVRRPSSSSRGDSGGSNLQHQHRFSFWDSLVNSATTANNGSNSKFQFIQMIDQRHKQQQNQHQQQNHQQSQFCNPARKR